MGSPPRQAEHIRSNAASREGRCSRRVVPEQGSKRLLTFVGARLSAPGDGPGPSASGTHPRLPTQPPRRKRCCVAMASSSEVQAPRISAAAPRTTADPQIPGAPWPEPNGAVRATQVGHVASRTSVALFRA
ncbi:hypothetical protein NDU88_005130 [Pleurodeles waltl]|uniref:Uncharacterized protein n=1 Tax=Pleurodeles waltl TaxID=8319 RepID=A0AAV7VMA9_PLEWA|nr:hypothetical protein NDU88_005130 [Pleurodeles waltl]